MCRLIGDEYDGFEPDPDDLPEEPPRDPTTDKAKKAVVDHVNENRNRVFYSRQLEVFFERPYFHWVTGRAVRELVEEKFFQVIAVPLWEKTQIRFLVPKGFRYYRRVVNGMTALVRLYSNPMFTRAIGRHAEMLFMNGLAQRGFVIRGRDISEYAGKKWIESKHDLDFVVERDGATYGVEVKNTLPYIPRDELRIKVRMCDHFGIVPLMIMRWAPKTYVFEEIMRPADGHHRGFALLFGKQIYPYGYDDLVAEIVQRLGLPVHSPRAVPDGDIDRFVNWHEKRVKKAGAV